MRSICWWVVWLSAALGLFWRLFFFLANVYSLPRCVCWEGSNHPLLHTGLFKEKPPLFTNVCHFTGRWQRKSFQLCRMETFDWTSARCFKESSLLCDMSGNGPAQSVVVVVFAFREAVLLGPASTAVQRAGAGRGGRSCQQADGQVCCKVSAEPALPGRAGWNNGGKILGPNSPLIHFHTFRVRWRVGWGGDRIHHFSSQQKLAVNGLGYSSALMEQFLSRWQIRPLRSEEEEMKSQASLVTLAAKLLASTASLWMNTSLGGYALY